ncbi:MAG: xanthine dehydrogenase small subunit [Xanthomonadales bacterium]|nr:xanthine dehydrogenase small subunit [Xanthomonadales bacterium]
MGQIMDDHIQFFLDGELQRVQVQDPTTTVLEYLREELGHTAVKEGCAEGDCGACTVVLAELHGQAYRLRSINACIQFLPTLDGKYVLTAEGLADAHSLHPVQQAMVDCHASQCGFCTPGFVMSLFALFKSDISPGRQDINHALSGNLCRCTGYRPIIDAARDMYRLADPQHADWRRVAGAPDPRQLLDSEQDLLRKLRHIRRSETLQLGDRYFSPVDEDELAALVEANPGATLLAGGTDVGLWVTKDYRELPRVIYLGNIPELQQITVDNEGMTIGAGANLTEALAMLVDEYPGFAEVSRRYASPPICNAGTLVGNVANGSPIGDSMPALMCLGTVLQLRQGSRQRELPLDRFYLGYQQTALEPGEYVSALRVPRAMPNCHFQSYKIGKRYDQDISGLCGAFRLQLSGGNVQTIDICFGGMAAVPQRAERAENALQGQPWSETSIRHGMAALEQDFEPISDLRATADYRRIVAGNLLLKFFADTQAGAKPNRVFDLDEALG